MWLSDYMEMLNQRHKFDHLIGRGSFKKTSALIYDLLKPDSKILDFGCGNGTLGYLGQDSGQKNVTVIGYDSASSNKLAKYHSLEEIGDERFDYLLVSHVFEHCTMEEINHILAWCRTRCDHLIVSLPNSESNIFVPFFTADLTHVRPYNNMDFLYVLNNAGFEIRSVRRSQLQPGLKWYATLSRLIFATLMQLSPFIDFVVFSDTRKG